MNRTASLLLKFFILLTSLSAWSGDIDSATQLIFFAQRNERIELQCSDRPCRPDGTRASYGAGGYTVGTRPSTAVGCEYPEGARRAHRWIADACADHITRHGQWSAAAISGRAEIWPGWGDRIPAPPNTGPENNLRQTPLDETFYDITYQVYTGQRRSEVTFSGPPEAVCDGPLEQISIVCGATRRGLTERLFARFPNARTPREGTDYDVRNRIRSTCAADFSSRCRETPGVRAAIEGVSTTRDTLSADRMIQLRPAERDYQALVDGMPNPALPGNVTVFFDRERPTRNTEQLAQSLSLAAEALWSVSVQCLYEHRAVIAPACLAEIAPHDAAAGVYQAAPGAVPSDVP